MADAIVTGRVVPSNIDQDIEVLEAAIEALVDSSVVDIGLDLQVSVDITHSEAADADGSAAVTVLDAALVTVGDCEVVGGWLIESDPVLNAPADGTLDISDAGTLLRTYTPVLSEGASLVSVEVTTNEIPSGAVVISRGNPQGHESQKSGDNSFDLTIGPAVAGDEVGSPHNVIVTVTDSNGRTDTDTIAITVQA